MIKLNREELHTFFPGLVKKIQEHHDMEDIGNELFVKRKAERGLCQIRNYFLEIDDDLFLQYVMEHIVIEPQLFLVARTLREVILYDGKKEFQLARLVDEASAKIKQKPELN